MAGESQDSSQRAGVIGLIERFGRAPLALRLAIGIPAGVVTAMLILGIIALIGSTGDGSGGGLSDASTCDDWYVASPADQDAYISNRPDLPPPAASATAEDAWGYIDTACTTASNTGLGPDTLGQIR